MSLTQDKSDNANLCSTIDRCQDSGIIQKVAVITGASRGIGLVTAKLFYSKGYMVYDLSRSGCDTTWCKHLFCDVVDPNSIKNACDSIVKEVGRIDTLVVNAGYGISGAVEFTSLTDAKKQFDVNFFGAFNSAKAFLPQLRQQGFGSIIFIGSVAGVFYIPFQSFYSATKSALNSLCGALRQEVKEFGIKVSIVLPGDTKTEFSKGRQKSNEGKEVYAKMQKSVSQMEKDEEFGASADCVAKVIYKVANKKHPPLSTTVGFGYKTLVFLKRILPETMINDIIGKIYCKK